VGSPERKPQKRKGIRVPLKKKFSTFGFGTARPLRKENFGGGKHGVLAKKKKKWGKAPIEKVRPQPISTFKRRLKELGGKGKKGSEKRNGKGYRQVM